MSLFLEEFGGGGSDGGASGAGACDIFWKECPSNTYVTSSTTNEQLWPCRRHLQQLTCVGTPQNHHFFLILFSMQQNAQCALLRLLRCFGLIRARSHESQMRGGTADALILHIRNCFYVCSSWRNRFELLSEFDSCFRCKTIKTINI